MFWINGIKVISWNNYILTKHLTCTWRSVCDTWGHAVPLYAVMGQWNQVMVA